MAKKKTKAGKKDTYDLDILNRCEKPRKKPGGPEGNLHRLKHGIFANRFLNEEERMIFDSLIEHLYKDFEFNKSSDFIQVELVAIYSLKLNRAQEAGDWDAAERLDRMIRCHMKDLKTTKLSREGDGEKKPEMSPAEWATALLEKVGTGKKEDEKEPAKPSTKSAKPKKRKKNEG